MPPRFSSATVCSERGTAVTRTAAESQPANKGIVASKFLLTGAFAGSALILVVAVVVALYTQNRLSTAVQRTTTQALPELLAALRLSERSALLAAATPTLSVAQTLGELSDASKRLDGLLSDVDRQLGLLNDQDREASITHVRRAVQQMGSTLEELKSAQGQRVRLQVQQRETMARIQKVHSELIDTVSPVVYGVGSLNSLFARRAQRNEESRLREAREVLYPRVMALLELKFLTGDADLNDEFSGAIRDRLATLQGLLPDPDFESLTGASESLLAAGSPFNARLDPYRKHLSVHVEKALDELGRALSLPVDQRAWTTPRLVEATIRDLSIAIDIKAEGSFLFALLGAVVEVNQLDALAGLEARFRSSVATFESAAGAFQGSRLAERNPILAGNVLNIAQQVVEFGRDSHSPFLLRRQQLKVRDDIDQLLSTNREIAAQLTEHTQEVVARSQSETNNVARKMEATREASGWVLLAVSICGLLLMALIAFTTIRMLDRKERLLQGAREATLSANQILDAIGYSARALLGSEFWEQVVDKVLARLGNAIHASRVTLYRQRCGEDGRCLAQRTHQWRATTHASVGRKPLPDLVDYQTSGLSRWPGQLGRGELLCGVLADFPAEERPVLEAHGIRSLLVVPITLNEVLWGFLSIDDCEKERTWTSHDREALVAAADNLGTAIARDRAAQDLRQAAIVFDSTQEGVLITDSEGTIVAANPAFTAISGYSPGEVIGKSPRIFRSDRQPPHVAEEMWAALVDGGSWQGEVCIRRNDGADHTAWLTINSVRDHAGNLSHFVGVFSDVATIKEAQARMYHLAHHDPLTDLPNRLLLSDRLGHAIERARRDEHRVAVLFLDLDRFKNINDTLGHGVGDAVLRQVAERLRCHVRAEDTVARLGGDEFMVVIDHLRHSEEAGLIAQKALDALAMEMRVDNFEFYLTGSIGISLYPDDGHSVDELIKNADTAMYRAKERGRNDFHYYTSELTADALEHFALEHSLRVALERNEFVLHYQPQRELATGRLIGVEALLRWHHPQHGLIGPDRFIPVAEDAGLMVAIGTWVLRTACAQAHQWVKAGLPPIKMAVNLSGKQIIRDDLPDIVAKALKDSGLPSERLELEITESFVMHQPEHAIDTLERLRAMGVGLAIDDFGTGHSSLSHLKRIPTHVLKIDRSFVRDMPSDPNDAIIARTIVAMGHALGLKVIAEGIENAEQAEALQHAGCDAGQGYLFGYPLPAGDEYPLLASELLPPRSGAINR
jgi:diguanylate cyclase (GGDEF)-like protein/PAS domain S-box-containing protein